MDNFMARMFFKRETSTTDSSCLTSSSTTATTTTTSSGASYENRVAYVGSQDAALKISAYHRALELRARTMSQMVWEYQRFNPVGGNYVVDNSGDNMHLNWLIQVRPNPLMTATDLYKGLEMQRIQQGNGVAYIERDDFGTIKAIWLCSSASLDIYTNTYIITYYCVGGMRTIQVPANDVIHIRNTYSNDNGLTGISTLHYMANALSLEATNIQLQTESAAKGGKMKLLLQEDKATQQGVMARHNSNTLKTIEDRTNEAWCQKDVIMLDNITSATPISMSTTDLAILESRAYTVADISRFLAVPVILLGDGSNASYKTYDDAMKEFYKHSLQPNVLELEDEMNSKILNFYDWGHHRIHVSDRNLWRLDPKGQAELNKLKLEIGAATINEVRKDYDQPSIAGGDETLISVQVQKVSEIGKKNSNAAEKGDEE